MTASILATSNWWEPGQADGAGPMRSFVPPRAGEPCSLCGLSTGSGVQQSRGTGPSQGCWAGSAPPVLCEPWVCSPAPLPQPFCSTAGAHEQTPLAQQHASIGRAAPRQVSSTAGRRGGRRAGLAKLQHCLCQTGWGAKLPDTAHPSLSPCCIPGPEPKPAQSLAPSLGLALLQAPLSINYSVLTRCCVAEARSGAAELLAAVSGGQGG